MRSLIGRAIVDTLGVAAAGFTEPVTRLALDSYRGSGAACWSGDPCVSEESAVMIDAIAAHAKVFGVLNSKEQETLRELLGRVIEQGTGHRLHTDHISPE